MVKKKILVIEDFPRVREVLDIFLTKAGYSVFVASNGKDGIELAQREKPELMLIDFKLQDLDGMEVLRCLRAFDKEAKIFIISGLYAEDLEKEALDNGATGFLSKSLGIEAIVKAACDVLA
ncbi:MAG: response regulator [Candidatus Omnitrophota bacterium]